MLVNLGQPVRAHQDPVALSREAIVAQALKIADRDGLGAVSMRRVGAELGYSGMSLYGHLGNKDELLGLMVDHVFGIVTGPDPALPWREAIIGFFMRLREVLLRHHAIGRIAAEHPVQGGHTQRHAREIVDALRRGGLGDELAVEAFIAMSCYTVGAVVYAAGRTETNDEAWAAFGSVFTGDDLDAGKLRDRLVTRTGATQFRSGLEHLVDGYAADHPSS